MGDASITTNFEGSADVLREFVVIELIQGMRQRADPEFQTALNNFAEGCCTEEDINLFSSLRDETTDWMDLGDNLLSLYHHNENVDKMNNQMIQKYHPTEIKTYQAKAIAIHNVVPHVRGPAESQITLSLAPGVPVMLLVNLNVKKGLANGTIGKVLRCDDNTVFCRFGLITEPIKRRTWKEVQGWKIFRQFPLRLAYSITSFKVQGKTFTDKPIRIDGKGMDRNGKYVALSRTTNRNLLRHRNITDDDFRVKEPCPALRQIRKRITTDLNFVQPPAGNRLLIYDSRLVSCISIT